ncbi:MAG TPA: PrsW family intramembrane metalloprotease [Thermoanaerobaculia bacterium]|nr:PrsW family intramembrane metalloprotease [Thermoanaerobaculia bacterium]
MDTFFLALVLSFVPAFLCAAFVYWLDRYEKEPLRLLGGAFFWGAFVAAAGALVSQMILSGGVYLATGSEEAADLAGSTLFAPLTEESLKGLAVLLVFLVFRREFDSLLDGLVYAGIVALGFAATENVIYLLGFAEEHGTEGMLGLFVVRCILGAWDHPFYTSFIGMGLAASRLSLSGWVRWLAPPLGWGMAVATHSLHNVLAEAASSTPEVLFLMFLIDWTGWLFVAIVILVAIRREGRLLRAELADEVAWGTMTAAQYHTAASPLGRSVVRLRALFAGKLGVTMRLYRLAGELAHKKRQRARFGDEGGNDRLIEGLRDEMRRLSPLAGS